MYVIEIIDKFWFNKLLDVDFLFFLFLNKFGIYSDLIVVVIILDFLEVYKEYILIFNLWVDVEFKFVDLLYVMANVFDKNSFVFKILVRVFLRGCFVDDKVLS